jgi:hypothetical protein
VTFALTASATSEDIAPWLMDMQHIGHSLSGNLISQQMDYQRVVFATQLFPHGACFKITLNGDARSFELDQKSALIHNGNQAASPTS